MALWTDIVDPGYATGFIRQSMEDYERTRGDSLARFLPNTTRDSDVIRMLVGKSGLLEEARWRAFDAEPEFGKGRGFQRKTVEMYPLSQKLAISEEMQRKLKHISDEAIRRELELTTDNVGIAIANAMERLRATTLVTGKATVNQTNFAISEDFGRRADFTTTAATLWTTPAVSRLDYLRSIIDIYGEENGEAPGVMLMSRKVFRTLATGEEFQTQLLNGGARNATDAQVHDTISSAGLPPIELNDRRLASGRLIPDNVIVFLPAPVAENAPEGATQLGATYWGTSLGADIYMPAGGTDAPGVVAAAHRQEQAPFRVTIEADAVGIPALANANLSLVAKVIN